MYEDHELHGPSPAISANVGGVVIAAKSIGDAAVLNLAGQVLDEDHPQQHDSALISSMATLLETYGLARAARKLRERSTGE